MDISISGTTGSDLYMLHGIQGTNQTWSVIADLLSQEHRCLLPNFTGRGKRKHDFNVKDLSLANYATELHDLVQHHGSVDPVLVGWSLGVSVILEYVSLYGTQAISSIVLISGSPALNQCAWFRQSDPQKLEAEIREREQRLQLSDAAHPAAVAALWSTIHTSNHENLLPTIDLPCLVIHGENDDDCPIDHGIRLATSLPNSQFVMIQNAGHSVLRSHPTLVSQSIREFLQNL